MRLRSGSGFHVMILSVCCALVLVLIHERVFIDVFSTAAFMMYMNYMIFLFSMLLLFFFIDDLS